MKPANAVALQSALPAMTRELTVADAAAASGLSLAAAEQALHALVSEYRGHLRVTEEGQILFLFPHGFTKPWETVDAITRVARRAGAALAGALRFVVRAWVAIVLVGYVAIFVAILIALAFGGKSERGSERGGGLALGLLRLVSEALFWTFHPFSPFRVQTGEHGFMSRGRGRGLRAKPDGPPFYERVDRFFFGPKAPLPDPDAAKKAVLAEIRAGKGRIGLADVMRVTGESREAIDPLMSRLLVDYDGTVEVSEEGGIAYRFTELRRTVDAGATMRAKPVWEAPAKVPPLTGNQPGQDFLIGGLNLFNLLASWWVLSHGLTIERMIAIFRQVPLELMPPPGTPIALGLVPLIFSIALFALPLGRLTLRARTRRRVARENGRKAVLRAVLEGARAGGVTEKELVEKYRIAAGVEPEDKDLTREVRALGGDVDLDRSGDGVHYRFIDLELEARAVAAEREAAADEEAKVGPVIFTSEDDQTEQAAQAETSTAKS